MKTSIVLEEFNALPSGAVRVIHATAPAIPESSQLPTSESVPADQDFREMLHRRHTAPFPVAFPYHHGGLNE